MHILDKIVDRKKEEIKERKSKIPLSKIQNRILYDRVCFSLRKNLIQPSSTGIIAEFKRSSPSRGIINNVAQVEQVVKLYEQNNVAGISILTDTDFFSGTDQDLHSSRLHSITPLLRKDFIIDEYQIHRSKSIGADVVLLIARILTKKRVLELAKCAKSIGLEVLLEVHEKKEIQKYNEYVDCIGVNNRDLKTFEIALQNSINLYPFLPSGVIKVSESGIRSAEDIALLSEKGYHGFLIGESFMQKIKTPKHIEKLINARISKK